MRFKVDRTATVRPLYGDRTMAFNIFARIILWRPYDLKSIARRPYGHCTVTERWPLTFFAGTARQPYGVLAVTVLYWDNWTMIVLWQHADRTADRTAAVQLTVQLPYSWLQLTVQLPYSWPYSCRAADRTAAVQLPYSWPYSWPYSCRTIRGAQNSGEKSSVRCCLWLKHRTMPWKIIALH